MTEDIILLELNSRSNTIQESSIVIIIADAMIIMNIIADAVITADMSIANNSCA